MCRLPQRRLVRMVRQVLVELAILLVGKPWLLGSTQIGLLVVDNLAADPGSGGGTKVEYRLTTARIRDSSAKSAASSLR